ncbi:hypothetical protein HNP37_000038 [Flavobacterium nitrogenifigens]|uniref:Uncharacterized protein n=2 Tax=Flavobacterium TaxID=237 RepID=A0A7W7N625_9FLAO|nr:MULTISPECIES: hypothetical protein [Flavobacterium]MBB4799999.1 hypothetical protein [Flavobacterium nitrogenifigens]MBB6386251.1 hypothetical protein [Flavobacterium notoginsengisoli]
MNNNKPKKLKFTKKAFLFVLTLILTNCQDSENITEQKQNNIKTVSISDAKAFLTKPTNSSSAKLSNGEISSLEFDKATQEKINGSDQLLTVIPFTTNNEVRNDRVLVVKIDDEIRSVIYSMQADEKLIFGLFTGNIFIYSLEGDFINGFRAEDGIIETQYVKSSTATSLTSKTNIDLKEVIIPAKPKLTNGTDWDMIWGNSGTSMGWSPVGGGGSGMSWDSTGGGGNGNGITAPPMAQIIDELKGKAKCIFEQLKNSSSGFENAIKKFDGEFTVSHLKLTINNNLASNVYGETQLPINFVTEIQISNSNLNNLSDLGAATVFAHEIIHAEIYRKMLSAAQIGTLTPDGSNMTPQQQINYINSMKDNFPGLYDYYFKRYKPTWNHEMMANHYRNTLADIIQQFDGNRLPRSTYEAITWLGLGKLDSNNTTLAWDNLPASEKIKITNLINENFYNGPSKCN